MEKTIVSAKAPNRATANKNAANSISLQKGKKEKNEKEKALHQIGFELNEKITPELAKEWADELRELAESNPSQFILETIAKLVEHDLTIPAELLEVQKEKELAKALIVGLIGMQEGGQKNLDI